MVHAADMRAKKNPPGWSAPGGFCDALRFRDAYEVDSLIPMPEVPAHPQQQQRQQVVKVEMEALIISSKLKL